MGTHQDLQIRRLLHAAREPIGSFSVYIGLLERERLTPGAQAYLKAIRANMKRAADAFEEIDFWLENGYPRPVTPGVSASTSQQSPDGVVRELRVRPRSSAYAASSFLKSPIWASSARWKAGLAVQRSM